MKNTIHILTSCLFMFLLPEISFSIGTMADQPFSESDEKGSKPLIRFAASFSDNTNSADFAVAYFDSRSTLEFDGQLDAFKLMNSDVNIPNFYFVTPSDVKLQIYALPPVQNTSCDVPLGIKINREGYVIIKIAHRDTSMVNMRISIKDNVSGAEQELLPDSEYKLYLPAGEYTDRFYLKMSNLTTNIREQRNKSDLFNVYYSYGVLKTEININSGRNNTLMVSNLLGQAISMKKIYESGYHEFSLNLKQGIYIITYISDNMRISKKIII